MYELSVSEISWVVIENKINCLASAVILRRQRVSMSPHLNILYTIILTPGKELNSLMHETLFYTL